jgi:hypothetical protein
MSEDVSLPDAQFEDEMPSFEDESEDNPFEGVDPATIVTIRPGAGDPQYLVIEEPTSFSVLMQRAGLTFNGQINMFVEGAEIGYEDLVQPGQTVTVIGNVKGGAA